jgi:transcriptional repressor NrdR
MTSSWSGSERRRRTPRTRRAEEPFHLARAIPYLVVVRCPSCGNADTRVVDSREAEDGASIRRRRACDACESRFTTQERAESARIQVLKRDGSRQEFDRRKLASAIGKAASKELSAEAIAKLIDDLEATIRASGTAEVAADRIGEMVLERLATLDPMSYLRFKIVYAHLGDPDALYDELATLVRRREEARERGFAEQTTLPLGEPPVGAGRTRRRR